MGSFYDNEIHVDFEQPVEIKKNKTYVIRNLGAELPKEIVNHILKNLQKQTGAKFIIVQGDSMEIRELNKWVMVK